MPSAAAARAARVHAADGLAPPRLGERPEAALVLAEAFRDNPLNRAVIGGSRARRLRSNRFGSRATLEQATGRAFCRVARRETGAICGVLLAQPPAAPPLPQPGISLQLRCLLGQGFRVSRAWSRVHFELARLQPAEPHWYLDLLGVAPDARRRGFGGALLHGWLEQVDADCAASYLETDRRENVAFYEGRGYAIVGEERVIGVPVWRMWRPAQSTGGKHVP